MLPRVTEVGTSNIFFIWKNEEGEEELITAPLEGLVLPGVVRDSVLVMNMIRKRLRLYCIANCKTME